MLGASITLFWLFPLLVKLFPRHYTALALLSVQNLIFAILWGSYHYGGASSPFLMWLLVVPLLAFFYLGSNTTTRLIVFIQIAAASAPSIWPISGTSRSPCTSRSTSMVGHRHHLGDVGLDVRAADGQLLRPDRRFPIRAAAGRSSATRPR